MFWSGFTTSMFLGFAQTKMQDFAVVPVGESPVLAKLWDQAPQQVRRNDPAPQYNVSGVAAPVDSSPWIAGVPPLGYSAT